MILQASEELINAIESDKRNEAIAFAEWILKSGTMMLVDENEYWWEDEFGIKEYTTEQLYDRYKSKMK